MTYVYVANILRHFNMENQFSRSNIFFLLQNVAHNVYKNRLLLLVV